MFHVEILLLSKLLTQSVVKFFAFILGFFLLDLVAEDMVRLIRGGILRGGGGGILRYDILRGGDGGILRYDILLDGSRGGGGGILLIFILTKKMVL